MKNKTRSKINNPNEKDIQQGLKDIKKGKVYSITNVAKKLGIILK